MERVAAPGTLGYFPVNGRFRTRQGIGTSAINPEKDNAKFIWLQECDLWVCYKGL